MKKDELKKLCEEADVADIINTAYARQISAINLILRCGIQSSPTKGNFVPRPLANYLTQMKVAVAQLTESIQIIEDCLEVDSDANGAQAMEYAP